VEALEGVECIIDVATQPSPEQEAPLRSSSPLRPATCSRPVSGPVCSGDGRGLHYIGCERFSAGYYAAKVAHERAHLSGPTRYVFCVRRSSTSS
jgi:hypothetical protein